MSSEYTRGGSRGQREYCNTVGPRCAQSQDHHCPQCVVRFSLASGFMYFRVSCLELWISYLHIPRSRRSQSPAPQPAMTLRLREPWPAPFNQASPPPERVVKRDVNQGSSRFQTPRAGVHEGKEGTAITRPHQPVLRPQRNDSLSQLCLAGKPRLDSYALKQNVFNGLNTGFVQVTWC